MMISSSALKNAESISKKKPNFIMEIGLRFYWLRFYVKTDLRLS